MTELATTTGGGKLALTSDVDYWTTKQLAALQALGLGDNVTKADLAVFHHVALRTGLDPFARQIHLIERQGKQTIQTGIDGFRLVARRAVDRSGETLSIGGAEWCDRDGNWTDVWLADGPPSAARVTVFRNGQSFPGIALWREYVQTRRDGNITAMWKQRPAGQLAKCAEALALRRAFPQDLSGLYTEDELARGDVVQVRRERTGLAAALDGSAAEPVAGEAQTPADPVADEPAAPAAESALLDMTSPLAKRMFAVMNNAGITDAYQREYISTVIGRQIESRKELTEADAQRVVEETEAAVSEPFSGGSDGPVDAEVVEEAEPS